MTDFADIRERLAEEYLLKDDGDIPVPGGFRDGAAARRDVAHLLTEVDRQAALLDEALIVVTWYAESNEYAEPLNFHGRCQFCGMVRYASQHDHAKDCSWWRVVEPIYQNTKEGAK
jgi:hypothetical protein